MIVFVGKNYNAEQMQGILGQKRINVKETRLTYDQNIMQGKE